MKQIFSIARYTFIENVRNKVFYIIVLFGVIVIGASLLLGALGGEQERRILLDLGLSAIEFFALITAGFAAVTLVLEEMESKTIYLVLSRPIKKINYLLGRYTGLLAAVFFGMLVMSAVHVGVLLFKGWSPDLKYIAALFLSAEKIVIISAVALFLSLFSSSAVSSISFTVFLWILGHFSEEIRFLGNKSTFLAGKLFAKTVYYIVPNLEYFNMRDMYDVPGRLGAWILTSSVYGLIYASAFILLSAFLFEKKEF
jgi:ABC-type transport system involved in multi-copper enzyme maturation permease subunit